MIPAQQTDTILPGLKKLGEIMEEFEREKKNGNPKQKEELRNLRTVNLDGSTLTGSVTDKGDLVEITLLASEGENIKIAQHHAVNGRQFETSSLLFDGALLRIFGRFTEEQGNKKKHIEKERSKAKDSVESQDSKKTEVHPEVSIKTLADIL